MQLIRSIIVCIVCMVCCEIDINFSVSLGIHLLFLSEILTYFNGMNIAFVGIQGHFRYLLKPLLLFHYFTIEHQYFETN